MIELFQNRAVAEENKLRIYFDEKTDLISKEFELTKNLLNTDLNRCVQSL